jgi:hypothetical protein
MDNFIAAKISKLKDCRAPDISKNKKYILNGFIMNHKLAVSLNNNSRRLVFNFIRKVEIAFNEYCLARHAIIDYLAANDQRVTAYFKALAHLENCIVHLYQAAMLFNGIIGEKQFKTDDDSILDRLNKVYNQIKYLESYSKQNQFKRHGSFQALVKYQNEGSSMEREDIGDLSTTPMWITNDGIECKMCVISFTALSKQITEYYEEAEACAIYDVNKHRQEVITEDV